MMALGKRKRRDQVGDVDVSKDHESDMEDPDLQALFRRHFEDSFQPLENIDVTRTGQPFAPSPSLSTDDALVWEGLMDESEDGPEIVELDPSRASSDEISSEELKSFMSARPPSTSTTSTQKKKRSQTADIEASLYDAANLKKDLELQRLLKESHLLEPRSSLIVSGKNRHKALDLRLQDLGSKSSVYTQHKMPIAHRRGMAAKAAEREEVRRREAQENGIILEKAIKSKKSIDGRRERALGIPSVGKFRGGMLKLSKNDVVKIQGPKSVAKRRR